MAGSSRELGNTGKGRIIAQEFTTEMVEGILGPIAQLFNWVLLGVVLLAVVKVIVVLSKDPKLKQRVFGERRRSTFDAIVSSGPTVKKKR